MNLSQKEIMLYLTLCRKAENKTLSHLSLSKDSGLHRLTVAEALKTLVAKKLITQTKTVRTQQGRANKVFYIRRNNSELFDPVAPSMVDKMSSQELTLFCYLWSKSRVESKMDELKRMTVYKYQPFHHTSLQDRQTLNMDKRIYDLLIQNFQNKGWLRYSSRTNLIELEFNRVRVDTLYSTREKEEQALSLVKSSLPIYQKVVV